MKSRARLVAMILACAASVGVMSFGVYAASRIGFDVGGTITYTPSAALYLQVEASATDEAGGRLGLYSEKTFAADQPDGSDALPLPDWSLNDMALTDGNSFVQFRFEILNYGDTAIKASFRQVGELAAGLAASVTDGTNALVDGSLLIAAKSSDAPGQGILVVKIQADGRALDHVSVNFRLDFAEAA